MSAPNLSIWHHLLKRPGFIPAILAFLCFGCVSPPASDEKWEKMLGSPDVKFGGVTPDFYHAYDESAHFESSCEVISADWDQLRAGTPLQCVIDRDR